MELCNFLFYLTVLSGVLLFLFPFWAAGNDTFASSSIVLSVEKALRRESLLLTTKEGPGARAERTRALNLTAALKRTGFSQSGWTIAAQIQLLLHFTLESG